MSPQVAMTKTLRKRSGARFMLTDNGERTMENDGKLTHFPFSIVHCPLSAGSAMDSGRDDHRNADDHGSDDDRERCVLVILDLFLDRERCNEHDHAKGERKNDQADHYENYGR